MSVPDAWSRGMTPIWPTFTWDGRVAVHAMQTPMSSALSDGLPPERATGIVDQEPGLRNLLREAGDRVGVRHVQRQGGRADGLSHFTEPIHPPGADHHGEALLREGSRRCGSDPARCSG